MNRRTLLAYINKLDEKSSALNAYYMALANRGYVQKKVWYDTQKQHWQGWLQAYTGEGAYNRKDWDRDARFIFNHINCPGMLLWLSDAAGVKKSLVTKAMNDALATNGHFATECRAIRQVITWDMIEAVLKDG